MSDSIMKEPYSNSRLNLYQDCQRKWWYHYRENWLPITTSWSLQVGKAFHDIYEIHLKGGDWRHECMIRDQALPPDYTSKDPPVYYTILHMMDFYLSKYPSEAMDIIDTEVEKIFELPNGETFKIRVDGIAKIMGQTLNLEHKTHKKVTETSILKDTTSRQNVAYVVGVEATTGLKVDGTLVTSISTIKANPPHKKWGRNVPEAEKSFTLDRTQAFYSQEDLDEWIHYATTLTTEITSKHDKEEFLPNHEACFKFGAGEFRCGYFHQCRGGGQFTPERFIKREIQ